MVDKDTLATRVEMMITCPSGPRMIPLKGEVLTLRENFALTSFEMVASRMEMTGAVMTTVDGRMKRLILRQSCNEDSSKIFGSAADTVFMIL